MFMMIENIGETSLILIFEISSIKWEIQEII